MLNALRPRIASLALGASLLAIPTTYYGCIRAEQGDSVGIVISPDFFIDPDANPKAEYTLAVRFLRPDRPTANLFQHPDELRLRQNLLLEEGGSGVLASVPFNNKKDEDNDYIDNPFRIAFQPADRDRDLSDPDDGPTIAHLVLFRNTRQEVSSVFSPLAPCVIDNPDPEGACFFQSDAKPRHEADPANPTPELDSVEDLTPVAFATIVVDNSRFRVRKIALWPYDLGNGPLDADKDSVVSLKDLSPDPDQCPFNEAQILSDEEADGDKLKKDKLVSLQCDTFREASLEITERFGAQLPNDLDCDTGSNAINAFEVDPCGNGDIDEDCDGNPHLLCPPTDNDGDGVCSGAAVAGLDPFGGDNAAADPVLILFCPGACDLSTGECDQAEFDDCNDANANVFPGNQLNAAECNTPGSHGGFDVDCNFTNGPNGDGIDFCANDRDQDTFTAGAPATGFDCDDQNANVNPGQLEICTSANQDPGRVDEDCNGETVDCASADADGDGHCRPGLDFYLRGDVPADYPANAPQPDPNVDRASIAACLDFLDCDDSNSLTFPGAAELCNDPSDNNCNGTRDEGCPGNDNDGDGFAAGIDCNDNNALVHPFVAGEPGGVELCGNAVDENCDTSIDPCNGVDADGDKVEAGIDCDDNDGENAPGKPERCDGKDNDCDGVVDEGNPPFRDGAGLVALRDAATGDPIDCGVLPADGADFDDGIANNLACQIGFSVCSNGAPQCVGALPPRAEICAGINVNTAGQIVNDRLFPVDDDCDDEFAAGEIDDDENNVGVNGLVDPFGNLRGDGLLACVDITANNIVDCDPEDPFTRPNLGTLFDGTAGEMSVPPPVELCDGKANDCGALPLNEADADRDGFGTCDNNQGGGPNPFAAAGFLGGEDCNDNDAAINPNAIEICDNIDNDCDGQIDEGCDDDNDNFCNPNLQVAPGGANTCPNTPNNGTANIAGNDCNDNDGDACNADGDAFCSAKIANIVSKALCAGSVVGQAGNDCNDNDVDTCNADNDAFCSASIILIESNALCAGEVVNGAGRDCNDNDTDTCNADNDAFCGVQIANIQSNALCTGSVVGQAGNDCNDNDTDACNTDGDAFCSAQIANIQSKALCANSVVGQAGNDCNDNDTDTCNADGDAFCSSLIATIQSNALCTGSVVGQAGNDCNDNDTDACNADGDAFCSAQIANVISNALCAGTPPSQGAQLRAGNDCNDNDVDACNADNDSFCSANIAVIQSTALCTGSVLGQAGNDCNDNNSALCDADGDTFCGIQIDDIQSNSLCIGSVEGAPGNDCNDNESAVFPNAQEICDGLDNNCSAGGGAAAEACQDGNATDGDGCSDVCEVETGHLFESEDNETTGTADAAGNVDAIDIHAAINANGADVDFFSIELQNNEDIRIETFDGSGTACAGINTVIELIDTNGTTLLVADDNDGQGNCSLINPAVDAAAANLDAGTYFIRVIESAQDANIAAYRLVITVTN